MQDEPQSGRAGSSDAARRLACHAARLMADRHFEDVRVLGLAGLSHVADYFVIGTGTSDRQIRSVAAEIQDLGRDLGEGVLGREGAGSAKWLVLDFVDVVIHMFEPETRSYYDLESLWADGQAVDWASACPAGGAAASHPAPDGTERT